MGMRTERVWGRIWPSGRHLWTRQWNYGFPKWRWISRPAAYYFQDCFHRREYSRAFISCMHSAKGNRRQRVTKACVGFLVLTTEAQYYHDISICHTAIFATVWRTTGRLSIRNRQWRRVYNSSREREFAKSPSNEKHLDCRYDGRHIRILCT